MLKLRPLIPLVLIVAGLNLLITDRFYHRILIMALIWAIAAMAWNLTAKAGQISLGHSAFTGIGAYTYALMYAYLDVSPWIGLICGMVLAMVAAVLIGLPSFKLEGFYFTLATIAYPLIFMIIAIYLGWEEVSVPYRPDTPVASMQFAEQSTWVWILLAFLVAVIVGQHAIDQSKFGYFLRAIRDNQTLAEAVGIRSSRWKLLAFTASAAVSAAVAVVWVNAILFVVTAEQVFGLIVVIQMLSFVFVGGIASLWGPIVGAGLLVPIGMVLSERVGDQFPGTEELLYGSALVLVALLMPEGIVWRLQSMWQRRRGGGDPDLLVHAEEAAGPSADGDRVGPVGLVGRPLALDGREAKPVSSNEVLLSVKNVDKVFGGLRALDDVTLDIHRNSMVGIIGPNGAGKTTLFNVMTGFLTPSSGSVVFEGRDMTMASPPDRFGLGISRTFQVPQGFSRMTAWENVYVAALGSSIEDPSAAAGNALEACGLTYLADASVGSLTTLEVKRLEIARAVASAPKLLLVDEPLAGLNAAERSALLDLLRGLGEQNAMTIVIIEHSVRSLISSVDRVVALHKGALLADGLPTDVIADNAVVEAYLGRKWATDAAN